MSMELSLFERAARLKLRFETSIGAITTEDLFDHPLTATHKVNLDDIARKLSRDLKESEVESFVDAPSNANTQLQIKLDVVKRVIEIKIAERDAATTARLNKARREQLQELIADKQHVGLAAKSLEELQAELAALGQ